MKTTNLVVGQGVNTTFQVTGSDGNFAPATAYSVSAVISDPTVLAGPSGSTNRLLALKAGTVTIVWTLTPIPGQGYTGAPLVLEAEEFVVNPKVLVSATTSYSPPS